MKGIGRPKDPRYEEILARLNRDLAAGLPRAGADARFTAPVVLVAGPPRSGTTLVFQLLAATGTFVYPTNLMARFYARPVEGWRVERLLEPLLPSREMAFRSDAGRTEEWFGPHELGYFWHAVLPFEEHHQPEREVLASWDDHPMAVELGALQAEDGRPLLVKNPILGYVLDVLLERLPALRVVWVERDPLALACSIYRTRCAEVGGPSRWWSVRPSWVGEAESRPPEEQIAEQLRSLREVGGRARESHPGRWLELTYEDVCRSPEGAMDRVLAFAGADSVGGAGGADGERTAPRRGPFEPGGYGLDGEIVERLRGALRAAGLVDEGSG